MSLSWDVLWQRYFAWGAPMQIVMVCMPKEGELREEKLMWWSRHWSRQLNISPRENCYICATENMNRYHTRITSPQTMHKITPPPRRERTRVFHLEIELENILRHDHQFLALCIELEHTTDGCRKKPMALVFVTAAYSHSPRFVQSCCVHETHTLFCGSGQLSRCRRFASLAPADIQPDALERCKCRLIG